MSHESTNEESAHSLSMVANGQAGHHAGLLEGHHIDVDDALNCKPEGTNKFTSKEESYDACEDSEVNERDVSHLCEAGIYIVCKILFMVVLAAGIKI